MAIEKVVNKTTFAAQAAEDKAYWLAKTGGQRLEAMTFLINEYFGLNDESSERLPRVLSVTRRKRG